jgi:hypothetical protein
MSFAEQISQLQNIYRLQHDLSNKITGYDFAEEQGNLSEQERDELLQMKKEFQQYANEEIALREKIKSDYTEAYTNYLNELHTQLSAIQKYLSSLQGELEFKHSFNKSVCKNLLSDLSKFIKNQKTQYDLNWLFDVSTRLIEEYKNTVK